MEALKVTIWALVWAELFAAIIINYLPVGGIREQKILVGSAWVFALLPFAIR